MINSFFADRSANNIYRDRLINLYNIVIEKLELKNRVYIRCQTPDEARKLEQNLAQDQIQTTRGLIGEVVEIAFSSRDDFTHLLLYGNSTEDKLSSMDKLSISNCI